MSDPSSELREAIATKYKAVIFDEWDYTDFLKHGLDSFIDSTLDAVIASLPPVLVYKSLDGIKRTKAQREYKLKVQGLLQSAKSSSKESE